MELKIFFQRDLNDNSVIDDYGNWQISDANVSEASENITLEVPITRTSGWDGQEVRVLSATVEQDDSYVELALQPKNLRAIDINSSVTLAYKDPKGDQTSKVIEDIFGNDLASLSGYDVEIVKI